MIILKLPLIDKHVYINLEKILFFEANKMGYTELHLDSGETMVLPITPEELCHFIGQPDEESDTLLLSQADLGAIFRE